MNYVQLWTLQMMMPIGFFACFAILYFILVLRSTIAFIIGRLLRICNLKIGFIAPPKEIDHNYEDVEKKKPLLTKILMSIKNNVYSFVRNFFNFIIWWFTATSNRRELIKIFNRIINAVFAFLSFSFIL